MIVVNIPNGKNEATTTCVYQWDCGRTLTIQGVEVVGSPEVHFTNEKSKTAIVQAASIVENGIYVDIPDEILEQKYDIKAFVYVKDSTKGSTIKVIHIPLIPRIKPKEGIR